ncbi:hypothetical protein [Candidatus Leptofilum sp.]|uniref:tetratricopeptide repeat protein n=1 Tax=Candidatus Leptofilum sp. TaxID=3241576 RepID=UPI003B599CA4
MPEINHLLQTAIQAAKRGEREKAHQLLLQIVEQDEQNETAWLWLSGTVKTKEDRQICLENVLAINPNNKMAQKGLQKLGVTSSPPHPTKAEEKEVWAEPVYDVVLTETGDPHADRYQDAWSSPANLCAYCAQPVQRTDKRCPKCTRKMVGKEPVSPNRSRYLENWILFRGVSHFLYILIILGMFSLITWLVSIGAFRNREVAGARLFLWIILSLLPLFIGITVALYFRKVWAYWLVMVRFVIVFIITVLVAIFSPPIPANVPTAPWQFIVAWVIFIIYMISDLALTLLAGPDFRREKRWRVAAADDRIKDPLVLDKAGKLFAQRGMWATAVLYWQRAVGRSPGNVAVLRRLANGYARLGFPKRSLDTLQQAQQKTHDPKTRQLLAKQIELMRRKIEQLAES